MPILSALRKLIQEDYKFKTNLDYLMKLNLIKQTCTYKGEGG